MTLNADALQRFMDGEAPCIHGRDVQEYCADCDKTNTLQAAIDTLGAVEVAPGFIAYPDDEDAAYRKGCWSVVAWAEFDLMAKPYREQGFDDEVTLRHLWRTLRTHGVEMPAWWTPERRFAWRHGAGCKPGPRITLATNLEPSCERITASLETGEEISPK